MNDFQVSKINDEYFKISKISDEIGMILKAFDIEFNFENYTSKEIKTLRKLINNIVI